MNRDLDIRDVFPAIRVPTLILNRVGDPVAPIEAVRQMAARIPDTRLIEFPGNTHLFGSDPKDEEINGALEEFVTGERPVPKIDRVLTTVVFTDVVGSTERAAELGDQAWRQLLAQHHSLVRAELHRFRGRGIDTAGDGFFAMFDGPAPPLNLSRSIRYLFDAPR